MSCEEIGQQGKGRAIAVLEIPNQKLVHLTIDLPTDLPQSKGYMAIVVFEEKLRKTINLTVRKKEISLWNTPNFFDHVFKLYGPHKMIISDWVFLFTSNFLKALFDLFSIDI